MPGRSQAISQLLQFFPAALASTIFLLFVALTQQLSGAIEIQIGVDFTGSTSEIDVFANPADANGAVGPTHYVEFINGRFAVYNKTNGLRLLHLTDTAFWNAAGISLPDGYSVSDPRLVFDPAANRWFAAQIDYRLVSENTNRLLLAVSTSADPTAQWKALAIAGDPSNRNFADFPTLGVSPDAVCLAATFFDLAAGNPVGSTLISIPKSDLLALNPSAARRTTFSPLPQDTHGFVLQPAVHLDPAPGNLTVLATPTGGHDFRPQTNLLRFTIQNPSNPSSATLSTPVLIPVPAFNIPINPPQPSGLSNLDNGDSRFSSSVCHAGNLLYAVHGSQIDNRAALQWYKLDNESGSLLQSGTITDPSLHFFYPAIAANTNGQVVIAFNACGPTTFVSSFAAAAETIHGVTTFGPPVLLKAGLASYNLPGLDGTSRWGDYSAINVDPADPSRFWTIQMVATATSRWSTQITELRLVARPMLQLTKNAGLITLAWPATPNSFRLEISTNLTLPTAWMLFPTPPTSNAGFLSITLPATGRHEFFRLKFP